MIQRKIMDDSQIKEFGRRTILEQAGKMITGYIALDGKHIVDGQKTPLASQLSDDWKTSNGGGYTRQIDNHTEFTRLTRLGLKNWKDDVFYQTAYCEGRKPYTGWERFVMWLRKKWRKK